MLCLIRRILRIKQGVFFSKHGSYALLFATLKHLSVLYSIENKRPAGAVGAHLLSLKVGGPGFNSQAGHTPYSRHRILCIEQGVFLFFLCPKYASLLYCTLLH